MRERERESHDIFRIFARIYKLRLDHRIFAKMKENDRY